jgi:hypothetical protein
MDGPPTSGPDNGAPSPFSRIVDVPLFSFLLALEIQKSRRLQYSVSLVCMHVEVRGGSSTMPSLAQRVVRQIRSTDVVVEFMPDSFALLLIHAEAFSLPAIVHRLTEHLQGFLPDPATLTWSAGGACYPQTAGGADALLRQARELMARAQNDGGDRLYLPAT